MERVERLGGTFEIESMIASDPHPPELTERQQRILEATSNGLSSEQIAIKKQILKI